MTAARQCFGVVLGALMWIAVWPMVAAAQEVPARNPLEPSDTSSPAATLNSLIDSCNELDRLISDPSFNAARAADLLPATERILDCLDLIELPKELRDTAGIESALFLKEVLDRIVPPADKDIPGVGSQPNAEPLLRWQIPSTRIAIARMETGPYQSGYLFTPGTMRRAAQDYRMVRSLPYRTDGRAVSSGLYDAYVAVMKQKPTQSADTSSPRGTLTWFLDSCDEFYKKTRAYWKHDDEQGPLDVAIISEATETKAVEGR